MANTKLKKIKFIVCFFIIFFIYVFVLFFILFNFNLLNNFSSVPFNKEKLSYNTTNVNVYNNKGIKIKPNIQEVKNVLFEEIPQTVIDAFISIEDKNFYKHKGVNYKRIVKALIKNIRTFSIAEGASTISQQLIKNTHLTNKKTLKRKIDEILLAKNMESTMTKNEIITAYLNAIYFGLNTFGINSASQRYFSKNVFELNLAESATLAGIINSPKKFSPINKKENCLKRRNIVLKEMLKDKKISLEEYNDAIKQDLNLKLNSNFSGNNNYYNCAVEEACNVLKMSEKDFLINNYKIYTYLDEDLQKILENEILKTKDIANDITNNINENIDSLATIVDNKTGGIKAFYGKSEHNLINIYRQPGSILKPIITYAPAIENNKIMPLTPILDEKYASGDYKPKNYKNKYYGWISAKESLAKSLNIPSVKILETIGIKAAKEFTEKIGINLDKKDNNLSIALGGLTKGLKILDIVNGYQTFANNGKFIKLGFVKEIRDNNNQIIYKHSENGKQVMKTSTAYLITDMLKESVNNGTSKKLKNNFVEIAAKTGTVGVNNTYNENSDLWNISYTNENTTCVWCGSTNKNLLNKNLTGGNLPTIIAKNIYAKQNLKEISFVKPNSVKEVEISKLDLECNNKLLLASPSTPDRYKIKAYFSKDNLPKNISNTFDKIEPIKLNLEKIEENMVYISFISKQYLDIELVRESEDNKKILMTIKNKTGKVEFCDKNLECNNFYNYKLIIKFANHLNILSDLKPIESNVLKIYLTQKKPNYSANYGF